MHDVNIFFLFSEENSSLCAIKQFTCANKKCLPIAFLCDGDDDCEDGSDEDPELCSSKLVFLPLQLHHEINGNIGLQSLFVFSFILLVWSTFTLAILEEIRVHNGTLKLVTIKPRLPENQHICIEK